jgi:KaiC/GvpD/RAD55 family RecA-like ATPase
MKYNETFPGTSILIRGEVPPAALLLIGPPGIGKTIFSKQFIINGLKCGEPCIYVSTDESPNDFIRSMRLFDFNIEQYLKDEMLKIVDCYTWKIGGKITHQYAVNNPSDLSSISISIEEAGHDGEKPRLVIDSITGLSLTSGKEAVLLSLHQALTMNSS